MRIVCYLPMAFLVLSAIGGEETNMLSVEETVRVAKLTYECLAPESVIKDKFRGNPAARKELYEIISDKEQRSQWATVAGYFYFVGQKEDVGRLLNIYDGRKGLMSAYNANLVIGTIYALAGMSARGIQEAKLKLDEFCDPNYWKDKSHRVYAETKGLNYENDMVRRVLIYRQAAWENDCPKIVEAAIGKVGDEKQREFMRESLKSSLNSYENNMKTPDQFTKTILKGLKRVAYAY